MVKNRITDGRRIAELLASELDGRSDGLLESITVTNADPDIEPTDAGARAYNIAVRETTVATAFVHPDCVRVETAMTEERLGTVDREGIKYTPGTGGVAIVVEHGAAVKEAVDLLVAAVEAPE